MSDHRTDDTDEATEDASIDTENDIATTPVTSSYKVLGELTDAGGVGVLGQNNAGSGTPIGVQGTVPNSAGGYGLYTPDDVRIEGILDTAGSEFQLETGTPTSGDANNVILGHATNAVYDDAVGAAIGGGGYYDGSTNEANNVFDNYGTVGGGWNNKVGDPISNDNPTTAQYATVSGGRDNSAEHRDATVGGGWKNTAGGWNTTVGGGYGNEARYEGATIAGGGNSSLSAPRNVVYDTFGTIGGGDGNRVGDSSTTSGREAYATASGGYQNTASGYASTVGGGFENTASETRATVGGGDNNRALGGYATIAGGGPSDVSDHTTRNVVYDDYGTIGGGGNNQAGRSDSVDAEFATVPGGRNNRARALDTFAAGRGARADHGGSFVWSDGSDSTFSSTDIDQFLIDASGGTGIGTNHPVTTFHVQDAVAESGGDNLGRHVAAIENTSSSSDPLPDVLGLELSNVTDPGQFHSYISFMDSTGTIGNIQGDGSGGVEFVGSLADFAEFFPKADPETTFDDGEVVGLVAGEVVDLADEPDPDVALVVSTAPLVTGNRPVDEDDRDAHVKLSLVGQVPVRVSAPVDHGDVLVASPAGDGTAVARSDGEPGRPAVGVALESGDPDDDEVLALVGGPGLDATPERDGTVQTAGVEPRRDPDAKDARIADLEAANERKDDRINELERRLADVEDRLASLEASQPSPTTADD